MITKLTNISCNHCWDYQQKLKEENEKLKVENQQLTGISGQLKAENEELKRDKAYLERTVSQLKLELRIRKRDKASHVYFYNDVSIKKPDYTEGREHSRAESERLIKFRLGDRVAVHREGRDAFRGTIFNIVNGKLSVIEDGFYSAHDDSPFLPSQCRKLKKVKKYCEHSGVELGKGKAAIQISDEVIAAAIKFKDSKPHICPGCKGTGNTQTKTAIGGVYDDIKAIPYAFNSVECCACNGTGIVWEA